MTRKRVNGEGTIYKRSDGRWAAVVSVQTGAGRKRKTYYGKTQREVAAQLTRVKRDQQLGIPPSDDRLTVAQLMDEWLTDAHARVRRSTFSGYRTNVERHIKPSLGSAKVAKLEPRELRSFFAQKLGEGLRPATVRGIRVILRAAFNLALREGRIARNVVDLVQPPKAERSRPASFELEQIRGLLKAARGERIEPVIFTAVTTGLREGELLGLQWADVDLELRTLTVRRTRLRGPGVQFGEPKSATSRRSLPLPETTADLLRRHRVAQTEERLRAGADWKDHDLVFASHVGSPIDARNLIRELHRVREAAGLPHLRFHDLRHACATFLIANGNGLAVVRDILGHSSIQLTADTYTHLNIEHQRSALASFDRAFGPANPRGSQGGSQIGSEGFDAVAG